MTNPQPMQPRSEADARSTWAFRVRGEDSAAVEIDIYDVIGTSFWNDGAVSAKSVRDALAGAKNAKAINVRINSAGGEVMDGIAIYNLLKSHAAKVTVQVDALAASIASIVAMAGDEIVMAESAFMMIHNPWGVAIGEASDMRKRADTLDKMRDSLVDIYAAKTGQSRDTILAALDAETWMTATEAKALGYATSVVPLKGTASAWNLTRFQRVPGAIIAAVQPPATEPEAPPRVIQKLEENAAPAVTAPPAQREEAMDQGHINSKLGLNPDASEADQVTAIDAMQRENVALKAEVARFVATSGQKTAAEAHGTFAAWRGQGDELTAARVEVARLTKNAENGEAKAIIDAAQGARKVVPATRAKAEAIYIRHGLDALKAHLDALVPVTPATEHREARVDTGDPAASLTSGRHYESMSPAERAELRSTGELGERMYQQLRTDWIKRGQPRAARPAA